MVEKNKIKKPESQRNSNAENHEADTEEQLDKTRMDVTLDPGAKEARETTKTAIHLDIGKEPTVEEKILEIEEPKKMGSKPKIDLKKILTKIRLPHWLTQTKKTKTKARESRLAPFWNIWIANPELPPIYKVSFYAVRLATLIVGIASIVILFQSSFLSLKNGSEYGWYLLGASIFTLFISVLSVALKRSACWFGGFGLLIILILLNIHVLFFRTTDSLFFPIFGQAPEYAFESIWMILLVVQFLYVFFCYPLSKILKLFFLLLIAYGLAGFWVIHSLDMPMGGSWQGVGFFKKVPNLFLQPQFMTLHFFIPLFFFFTLFYVLFVKKTRGAGSWIFLNALILLLLFNLGLWQMQKSRIPNILTLFIELPLGITMTELKTDEGMLVVQTVNYETDKEGDQIERFQLKLLPYTDEKKSRIKDSKESEKKYLFEAHTLSGLPLYFLDRTEFILSLDTQKITKWTLTPLDSEKETQKKKEKKNKEIGYQYLLTATLPQPEPIFEIRLPERGPVFTNNDLLKFELSQNSVPLQSFVIEIDNKIVLEKKDVGLNTIYEYPLSNIELGKHVVKIYVLGKNEKRAERSQEILILEPVTVDIYAPMEGDYFLDNLSVVARIQSLVGSPISNVVFYVDDQQMSKKSGPPYQVTLDTKNISSGKHVLKIVASTQDAQAKNEEYSSSVSLVKGDHPVISFTQPTLGEFVPLETPVEVEADGKETFESVDLFLGDQVLHQWKTPPFSTKWNTQDLEPGDYLLRSRLKTLDGIQYSDWVHVHTGEGMIFVSSKSDEKTEPSGKPDFKGEQTEFRYKKVIFVVDASISQLDSWNGKPKWEWIGHLFRDPSILSKLKGVSVGVAQFGGHSPYDHHNCHDAGWISPVDTFNKSKIYSLFKEVRPTGISALFSGLLLALKEKPQKIIILTDGGDGCYSKISPAIKKQIKDSGTLIDIVTLGTIPQERVTLLEEVINLSGGHLFVAKDGEDLSVKVGQITSLYYQLKIGDKTIYSGPIDSVPTSVRPGKYNLSLSMEPPLKGQLITVRNGLMTHVKVSVEGGTAQAIETFESMRKE